jgi:hypothetical protein
MSDEEALALKTPVHVSQFAIGKVVEVTEVWKDLNGRVWVSFRPNRQKPDIIHRCGPEDLEHA